MGSDSVFVFVGCVVLFSLLFWLVSDNDPKLTQQNTTPQCVVIVIK